MVCHGFGPWKIVVWLAACAVSAERTKPYTFDDFKEHYGRSYKGTELKRREALFEERVAIIEDHNGKNLPWKMGINHLIDWTEDELQRLRGWRGGSKTCSQRNLDSVRTTLGEGTSIAQTGGTGSACAGKDETCLDSGSQCCEGLICGAYGVCTPIKAIPEDTDWSSLPSATSDNNVDQGKCGSCWACASTFAIQMQAAMVSNKMFNVTLSPQNMLACTPNKLSCGGEGGCQGATPELGFEWARSGKGHLETVDTQKYLADSEGGCPLDKSPPTSFLLQTKTTPGVRIRGWRRIQENDVSSLMNALVTAGPLVTTIAGNILNFYKKGVITNCTDWTVDHSVVMMGFGKDDKIAQGQSLKYWKIRNSWGHSWGEGGFFRLLRNDNEPCGWDTDPSKGVACKDKEGPEGKYPEKQWVCGSCGIMSDTTYPVGVVVHPELLSSKGDSKGGKADAAEPSKAEPDTKKSLTQVSEGKKSKTKKGPKHAFL